MRETPEDAEPRPWKTLNRASLLSGGMNGHPSRRGFLAACGLAATAGCAAPGVTGDGTNGGGDGADSTDTSDDASATETEPRSIDLPGDASWPTFAGDAANSGRRDTGPGPAGPARTAWRTDVDGIYTMPGPVVGDGQIYVGSGETAYAADVQTGDPLWTVDMGALTHFFSPTITESGVLFGAQSTITGGKPGTLAAFDTEGKERWQQDLPLTTSPSELDGDVFVGVTTSDGAAVRSFTDADGSERWSVDLGIASIRGAPAIVDDTVYATARDSGDGTGVLAALSVEDGEKRWSKQFDTELQAAPAVRDGVVYAQGSDGRLFALDAASGESVWTAALGSKAKTTPALGDERLVAMVENQLVGVSVADGAEEWRTDIGFTLINGVSRSEDRVYVGGSRLSSLDVATGEVVWELPVPGTGGGFGAPVVLGNTVFVGVCIKEEATSPYDDYLYAYI